MAWPKKVPILSASDIHRGDFDGPNDTHCLRGWLIETFDDHYMEASLELFLHVSEMGYEDPVKFNDDSHNSCAKVASVWNKTMRKLGYTVTCDR